MTPDAQWSGNPNVEIVNGNVLYDSNTLYDANIPYDGAPADNLRNPYTPHSNLWGPRFDAIEDEMSDTIEDEGGYPIYSEEVILESLLPLPAIWTGNPSQEITAENGNSTYNSSSTSYDEASIYYDGAPPVNLTLNYVPRSAIWTGTDL